MRLYREGEPGASHTLQNHRPNGTLVGRDAFRP